MKKPKMRKKTKIIGVCLVTFVVISIVFLYTQSKTKQEIIIENNRISLYFSGDNYNLIKYRDKENGKEINFLASPLWKIVYANTEAVKENTTEEVFLELKSDTNTWVKGYRILKSQEEKILELTWHNQDYGKIVVNIKLSENSWISTWTISVENYNTRYSVWYVDFPYLRVQPINGEKISNILALPVHGGAIIRNPFDNIHWEVTPWDEIKTNYTQTCSIDVKGSYPGNYNAQFATLYSNAGIGLYFASYDGDMYSKRFLFNGNEGTLEISIRNYPENMLTPKVDYNVPYEFKVGIFHGDWMNAADIYKAWAKKQIWCQKGPMYQWKDLSKFVYDADLTTKGLYRLSLSTEIHYTQIKENLVAMKEFFETYANVDGSAPKIGIHWIGWSKYLDVVNSNSGFPNYLPPQQNFTQLIDYLHSIGCFYSDVYLTLIGADMNSPYDSSDEYSWADCKEYATYNPLGRVYTRFTPYCAWMDPSQRGWQNIMGNVSSRSLEECHLDGEYFDWYPKYRLDFKHHEGGGDYFAKGYREEAYRIREYIRKNHPDYYCYPEGKSEIEIGVFDIMLMEWFYSDSDGIVSSFAGIGTPIPLITYLYHEYIGMVGGIRVKNKDFSGFKNPSDFRIVSAIIWTWGNKPYYPFLDGRYSNDYVFTLWKEGKLDPVWVDNLKYLANLTKMYKIGKDALFFGEMVRPPKVEGMSEKSVNFGDHTISVPTVVLGAFRSADGKIYIPITNWGEKRETITGIDFSGCAWGLRKLDKLGQSCPNLPTSSWVASPSTSSGFIGGMSSGLTPFRGTPSSLHP